MGEFYQLASTRSAGSAAAIVAPTSGQILASLGQMPPGRYMVRAWVLILPGTAEPQLTNAWLAIAGNVGSQMLPTLFASDGGRDDVILDGIILPTTAGLDIRCNNNATAATKYYAWLSATRLGTFT